VTALEAVEVVRVIDGDTLELSNKQVVRLIGINTPESSMPFYYEATELLQKLVQDGSVQMESRGVDKYSRTLAYLFVNNKNINKEILVTGIWCTVLL